MTHADVLRTTDFVRGSRRDFGDARPDQPHKEWHHFVVHDGRFRLIVNFSAADGNPPMHRVIALVRTDAWAATVDEFEAPDVVMRSGHVAARFGACEFTLRDGAYELTVECPSIDLRAALRIVPISTPFVANNQPLTHGARISWLFVPRLAAFGEVRIGDRTVALHSAAAYHDHNWGRFRWGDDFGWDWGSVLPDDPADPWTIVCMRMTDRSRRLATRQTLWAWYEQDPVALFSDSTMSFTLDGFLRRAPVETVPGVMRIVRTGSASDVPAEIVVTGRSAGDELQLRFRPQEYVRIVIPDEVDPLRVVVLNEISGHISATGRIGVREMQVEGAGVFEILH